MKRANLHESPITQMVRKVSAAQRLAEAAHTRPSGTTVLRESADIVWNNGTDTMSVRDLPASMQTVIEAKLAEGLATEGRRNTVSTSNPPADVTGYPDGAYWTKVPSASDMTVSAVWQLTDGSWVSQSIPDGGLVRSWADIGLLQVSTLAAKLITSGFFRTGETGKRIEVDALGFRAYDEAGNNTVNVNGFDNLITGGLRTAADGRRVELLNQMWGPNGWVGLRFWPFAPGVGGRAAEVKVATQDWEGSPYLAGNVAITSGGQSDMRSELVIGFNQLNFNVKNVQTNTKFTPLSAEANLDPTGWTVLRGQAQLKLEAVDQLQLTGANAFLTTTGWGIQFSGANFNYNGRAVLTEARFPTAGGNNGTATQIARSDHLHDGRYADATHSHPLPDIQCLRRSNIDYYINNGQAARINFDLGTLGSGMSWDATNRQLVINTSGLYEICYGVAIETSATTPAWYPRLQVNGTTLYTVKGLPNGGAMLTKTIRCTAGTRISVEVGNYTGAQIRVLNNADLTFLSAILVGVI